MKLLKNAVFYTRYSNSYDMVMPYVYGNVYNDDRFSDSTQIQTTAIIGVEGNVVETMSGSKYAIDEKSCVNFEQVKQMYQ